MTTGSLRNRLFLAAVVFFFCGSMISMQALEETDSVQDAASVMEVLVEDDGAISVVSTFGTVNDNAVEHVFIIVYSDATESNFDPVVNFLEKEFPSENMQFVREHLPVSPIPELLSKLVPICQAISIAWVIVGGKKLLRWLPMYRSGQRPLPRFYWIVQDNSIPILIFLFLLAPPLTKNLQVGNAVFDIYDKGNALIFSAKKAGLRPALLVDAFLKAGLVQSSSNAN